MVVKLAGLVPAPMRAVLVDAKYIVTSVLRLPYLAATALMIAATCTILIDAIAIEKM